MTLPSPSLFPLQTRTQSSIMTLPYQRAVPTASESIVFLQRQRSLPCSASRFSSIYSSVASKASEAYSAVNSRLSSVSPSALVAASLLGGMAINSAVQPDSHAGHAISLSGYDRSFDGVSAVEPVGGYGYSSAMSSGHRGTSAILNYAGEEYDGSELPLTKSVYAQHLQSMGSEYKQR
jgi:hypothetical protein